MQRVFENHNVSSEALARCARAHPGHHAGPMTHPHKCLFAEFLAPVVRAPLFSVISAFDSWQLEFLLCPRCAPPRGLGRSY